MGIIEITVFSLSCLLLIGTICFVKKTINGLRVIKAQQIRNANRMVSTYNPEQALQIPQKNLLNTLIEKVKRHKPVTEEVRYSSTLKPYNTDKDTVDSLKQFILLQQQQLKKLLEKVDSFVIDGPAPKINEAELNEKIDRLELLLEEKDEELLKLQQNNKATELLSSRLEKAQRDFDLMQERMVGLEKQAGTANQLAMELEDIKDEYNQLQKEQQHKQEKIQDLINENARLHQQLCDTEDKLLESNNQRQQFMKKARLLEELNTDFQFVSDTNSKMKNELRRIGELESMLNMMTEERNHLLHKTPY